MFSPGEEVLCIKSGWGSKTGSQHQARFCPNVPSKGRIYTIRACWQTPNGLWWVLLNEIVNPTHPDALGVPSEPIFAAEQFAPIKRTDTDISEFKRMLIDVRQEEKA